jgi:hypothetical protein
MKSARFADITGVGDSEPVIMLFQLLTGYGPLGGQHRLVSPADFSMASWREASQGSQQTKFRIVRGDEASFQISVLGPVFCKDTLANRSPRYCSTEYSQ